MLRGVGLVGYGLGLVGLAIGCALLCGWVVTYLLWLVWGRGRVVAWIHWRGAGVDVIYILE